MNSYLKTYLSKQINAACKTKQVVSVQPTWLIKSSQPNFHETDLKNELNLKKVEIA